MVLDRGGRKRAPNRGDGAATNSANKKRGRIVEESEEDEMESLEEKGDNSGSEYKLSTQQIKLRNRKSLPKASQPNRNSPSEASQPTKVEFAKKAAANGANKEAAESNGANKKRRRIVDSVEFAKRAVASGTKKEVAESNGANKKRRRFAPKKIGGKKPDARKPKGEEEDADAEKWTAAELKILREEISKGSTRWQTLLVLETKTIEQIHSKYYSLAYARSNYRVKRIPSRNILMRVGCSSKKQRRERRKRRRSTKTMLN